MAPSTQVRVWASGPMRLLAVGTAVALVVFALAVAGHPAPRLLGWALIVLCGVCTVLVCRQPTLVTYVAAPARSYWRLSTYGLCVVTVAMLLRAADELMHEPAVEVTAEVMHGLGGAACLVALFRLPIGQRTRSGRITLWLDITIAMSAAAVLILVFVPAPANNVLATVGLVMAGLIGTFLAVKVTLTGSDALSRGALQMIALSAVAGGIGGAISTALADHEGLNFFLLYIPMSAFAVSLAARRQLSDSSASRATISSRTRPYSLLPYIAVAAVDVLLIYVVAREQPDRLLVAVGAVLLTAMVTARQIWSFRENVRLTTEVQQNEQRFRLLVQNANDIIAISERSGSLRYISPAVRRILGYEPQEILGATLTDYTHPDDLPLLNEALDPAREREDGVTTMEVRCRHADGSWKWLEMIFTDLFHEPGIRGRVNNIRDISETRHEQDRLSHEATHDALTGLANRLLFNRRMVESLASGTEPISIVLIDLDDFKIVNDTLGHATGDALLIAAAGRLQAGVRATDTVARLGGDEFALLLPGLAADTVDRTLVRISESLLLPVEVGDHFLSIRASFGVATGGSHDDPGELLRQADIAMYEAKSRGIGGHQHFRLGMEARGVARRRLIDNLATAIEQDQLVLHYQPVVQLSDRRITGVEALVRWQHPTDGLLGPYAFIEAAEESALIVPLGRWVLREAVRQAAAWGPSAGTVSVNVSGVQLRAAGFAEEVMAALRDSGLPAQRLIIEITESIAVGGGATAQNLAAVREQGVRLSLDDFGTGSSTLTTVAQLAVDQIKLDRSFVDSQAIAGAVLHLARGMGAEAIAEGVETDEQASRLKELGYERVQGYLFSRPVPADELAIGQHHRPLRH